MDNVHTIWDIEHILFILTDGVHFGAMSSEQVFDREREWMAIGDMHWVMTERLLCIFGRVRKTGFHERNDGL
jgi:hypothetical protein